MAENLFFLDETLGLVVSNDSNRLSVALTESLQMLEDRRLVHRFNRGDKDAFRRIYEKYQSDMLKVAGILLNDKYAIEDVLHDVFVAFARNTGNFRLKGSLKGYLAVCVANRARDVNRTAARRRTQPLGPAETQTSDEPSPERPIIDREIASKLEQALSQLPFDQIEAIVLHLQSRMSFKEIAGLKGLSINTVMSRYRYGLNKMRSLLDGAL